MCDPIVWNTPCNEHFDSCANILVGDYRVFPFHRLETYKTILLKSFDQNLTNANIWIRYLFILISRSGTEKKYQERRCSNIAKQQKPIELIFVGKNTTCFT